MKNSTVLVSGASGNLGEQVVREFINLNHKVV